MIEWFNDTRNVVPVLAAFIAACSAWFAGRQYRMARQRDREQHAAKVAVWDEDGIPKYVNTSGLPIWAVSVEFDGQSEPAERGCWPPAQQPIDARTLLGTDAESLLRSAILDALDRPGRARSWVPRVIEFTDGNDRRWRRDLDGTLSEVKRKRGA
ncbi:hypothetical protein ABT324_24230 [Saccharopolyspora sp. NPDC000359]|uniref:hypothetical protein n=1 Tax=Saccharopolyspora sp. NPDC000359 TaxID=3154251 RepID=UPI0033202EBB